MAAAAGTARSAVAVQAAPLARPFAAGSRSRPCRTLAGGLLISLDMQPSDAGHAALQTLHTPP